MADYIKSNVKACGCYTEKKIPGGEFSTKIRTSYIKCNEHKKSSKKTKIKTRPSRRKSKSKTKA